MFENIIGNEKNKEILKKSIELKNISHSYMFWGIEGIGKKMIAKEFAKMILCSDIKKNGYCGKCKSCIEFNSDNNPDFKLIEPNDGKIKIEQIREMQRKIAEKPIISSQKVYIIDNADTMTVEAQNCLLKTLEEPPEYITIILICSNENTMLSTIKSRCARMYFEPISDERLKTYIKNTYGDEEIEDNFLKLAQGSIGKALKIKENMKIYESIKNMLINLKKQDVIEIVKISNEIYKSKEEIQMILEYINVFALELSKKDIRYIKCIEIIEETKKRLKSNSNYDMTIDNMLFKMCEI